MFPALLICAVTAAGTPPTLVAVPVRDKSAILADYNATQPGAASGPQPVFNLEVLNAESFFVGERGMLVHDNSPVHRVLRPFDAVAERAGEDQKLVAVRQ